MFSDIFAWWPINNDLLAIRLDLVSRTLGIIRKTGRNTKCSRSRGSYGKDARRSCRPRRLLYHYAHRSNPRRSASKISATAILAYISGEECIASDGTDLHRGIMQSAPETWTIHPLLRTPIACYVWQKTLGPFGDDASRPDL